MIALSAEPVRRKIRHIRKNMSPLAVILAYHRVNEGLADPQRLIVRPDYFSEQMDVLKNLTEPVPLPLLLDRLKKQPRNARPLSAVTFDDGYADNFRIALPILRRAGIPATFFLEMNAMTHPHEHWWDELERILLRPGRPDSLCIQLGDQKCRWSFEQDRFIPGQFWNVHMAPYLVAQEAYIKIAGYLRTCAFNEREKILDMLFVWAGIERFPRDENRTLTEEEVKQQAADELVCIGSHSISHSCFSVLDPPQQAQEIETSRSYLENLIGRPVQAFAYPYGRMEDYNLRTIHLLRKNGFQYACTTVPGLVNRWDHPLKLPRFTVGNWPGCIFRTKLENVLVGDS